MENAEKILEYIAKKQNCSVKQIKEKIMARIQAGFNDSDSTVRAQWKQIPCAENIPTPEEYLDYIIDRLDGSNALDLIRMYLIL